MVDHEQVCVLIPTYDEAETIGDVVTSFREQGFENVLVVDGDSNDGTQEIARDAGARVVQQSGQGQGNMKGQAVREGLQISDAPVVLMLDGDWTYRAEDAEAMLEPIFSGRADHVIGNRFADMEPGAITRLNTVGNRIINRGFRLIHGRDYVDILSGYRALTRDAIERVSLTEDGFGIETELAVECVKHNVRTEVVPIRYRNRPDDSETNLHPFKDGAVIILTLYRMAKTNNPLFYFGSVGIASTLVGAGLGAYVAYEWIVRSISHEVIAVVGSFAILFGVQLLMFGVLSDMMVTVNREQTRRLEELAERLSEDAGPSQPSFDGSDGVGGDEDGPDEFGSGVEGESESDRPASGTVGSAGDAGVGGPAESTEED